MILPDNINVDSVYKNIRAHIFGSTFLGSNIHNGVNELRLLQKWPEIPEIEISPDYL